MVHHELCGLCRELVVEHNVSVAGLVEHRKRVSDGEVRCSLCRDDSDVAYHDAVLNVVVCDVSPYVLDEAAVSDCDVLERCISDAAFHGESFFELNSAVEGTDPYVSVKPDVEDAVGLELVVVDFDVGPVLGIAALVLQHENFFFSEFAHIVLV